MSSPGRLGPFDTAAECPTADRQHAIVAQINHLTMAGRRNLLLNMKDALLFGEIGENNAACAVVQNGRLLKNAMARLCGPAATVAYTIFLDIQNFLIILNKRKITD
jgi:hypothetical protein